MNEYYTLIKDCEKEIHKDHKETLKDYKEKGQIDGRMNSPDSSFEGLSPAELAIRAIYSAYIGRFKASAEQIIAGQKASYEHIGSDLKELHEYPEIITKNIKDLKNTFESRKVEEQTNHQSNITQIFQNPNYTGSKHNYQDLENRYKLIAEKLDRTLPIIPKKWYFPILLLMGISEFYLTYSAFASNGDTVLGTSIMALSAGVVFPILAHFSGKILKQGKKDKNNIIIIVLIFIIAIGLAMFLAKQVVNFGISNLTIANENEANTTFIMRILIVLGIFVVGVLISFFNHEPDLNFLDTYRLREDAKLNFEKLEKEVNVLFNNELLRFQELNRQLTEKLQNDVDFQNGRIKILLTEFQKASKGLEETKDYYTNILKSINAWYKTTIHEYRQQNLRNRVDRKFPTSWNIDPSDII